MKSFLPFALGLTLAAFPAFSQPLPWTVAPDRVTQGDAVARAPDGRTLVSNASGKERTWTLSANLDGLPQFSAPGTPLVEALWNLSLEEVLKDQLTEGPYAGALSAGAQWPGVWTRDAAYAAHLSLAWLFPEAVKASLRAKAAGGRIIQDTGTGGSWPVSTDRVVWALAARELARTNGDRGWINEAYPLLVQAAETDRVVAYDPATGLYYGETSFLDWREQTYPAWYQPADIFQSPALGTNVLHRELYATLEEWAGLLGRPAEAQVWHDRGAALTQAIDSRFWAWGSRRYSMHLLPVTAGGGLSGTTDALGNALVLLAGIAPADRASGVVETLPLEPFGPPVIYPQLAQTGPYHNKAVWPFVTAYYGWALGRAGSPGAAAFALEANLRAGALFLTNKENLVHDTGDFRGTAVNSDRQLWSAAGQLAGILRTLVGLNLDGNGLTVAPAVPAWVKGPLTLTGLPWVGRALNVAVTGTGSRIATFTIDGRPWDPARPLTAADLPPPGSTVTLAVTLAGDPMPPPPPFADTAAKGPWGATNLTFEAATRRLTWKTRAGVATSWITRNGVLETHVKGNAAVLPPAEGPLTVWSVVTANDAGILAPPSEPFLEARDRVSVSFADRDLGELVGDRRTFDLTVPFAGRWLVRFHYTNTSGPVSTDNKAAVRLLGVDGGPLAGALVFPQRGYVSTNRGWSSSLTVDLTAGAHTLTLAFTPECVNMDGTVNRAVVDGLEALPLP